MVIQGLTNSIFQTFDILFFLISTFSGSFSIFQKSNLPFACGLFNTAARTTGRRSLRWWGWRCHRNDLWCWGWCRSHCSGDEHRLPVLCTCCVLHHWGIDWRGAGASAGRDYRLDPIDPDGTHNLILLSVDCDGLYLLLASCQGVSALVWLGDLYRSFRSFLLHVGHFGLCSFQIVKNLAVRRLSDEHFSPCRRLSATVARRHWIVDGCRSSRCDDRELDKFRVRFQTRGWTRLARISSSASHLQQASAAITTDKELQSWGLTHRFDASNPLATGSLSTNSLQIINQNNFFDEKQTQTSYECDVKFRIRHVSLFDSV